MIPCDDFELHSNITHLLQHPGMMVEDSTSSSNGGSIKPSMGPPVFQTASSILRSTAGQTSSAASASTGSLRNALGGQPSLSVPTSAPSPSTVGSSSTAAAGLGDASSNAPQISRPINRPAASKNSIIYNAVQVIHINDPSYV